MEEKKEIMENTKLNPFIRIRGNAQRGDEVIAELERRGGRNSGHYDGTKDNWYFIDMHGTIDYLPYPSGVSDFFLSHYEEVKLPRWRAKEGEEYWYLDMGTGGFRPLLTTDKGFLVDGNHWNTHNYFSSEAEAQEKADAINAILRGDYKL